MNLEKNLEDSGNWTLRKMMQQVDDNLIPIVYQETTTSISDATVDFYPSITINRGVDAGLFSDVKICMIGSSTFAGAGSYGIMDIEGILNDFLSRKCTNYTLTNASVGGYTTYKLMPSNYLLHPSAEPDVSANVTYAIETVDADIVLINSPSNDIIGFVPLETVMENFKRITDEVISHNKQFIICDVNPRDELTEVYAYRQMQLAYMLQNEYKENYVPWFTDYANVDAEWDPQYYVDGTHGNRMTHLRFAEKTIDRVYQMMSESTKFKKIVIERSTDNISFLQVGSMPISKTSFNDYNVESSTTYYYRVKMIGENCNSSFSNTITALSGTVPIAAGDPPVVVDPPTGYTKILNMNFGTGSPTPITGYNNIEYWQLEAADIGTSIPLLYDDGTNASEAINVVQEIAGNSSTGVTWAGLEFDPLTGMSSIYTSNVSSFTVVQFTGFPANQSVDVLLFGARASTAVDRVTLYEVSGTQAILDAANNTTNFITISGVADSNGVLEIKFMPNTGSIFGYINAVSLRY